ncbi:MAG: tyrosine-type recombinase/integrase [Planctomycetota bacterium]|jgi:integrase
MATREVGIYRKYHGPIPTDRSGQPVPRSQWPKRRAHSWVVRWFDLDGKRHSRSFRTRKEAEYFAEGKQSGVRDRKPDPAPRISLRDFHKEHRELMQGNVAKTTLRMQLAAMEHLARDVGWKRPLQRITTRDIERLRAKRLKTGISPWTANKEVKLLRRVLNLAILRGYLPADGNPCEGIPMLRAAPGRPRYIRPEEFHDIYRQAEDSLWRSLLVTFYTTALRSREAMHLRWCDLDFEEGQLHVTHRAASGFVQRWTPKDHAMRSIPLAQQAASLLAAWQSVAPEGCPYVFMEHARWDYYRQEVEAGHWREGQDPIHNLLRRFKTLCRYAGVGPYTLHDLRRSCITNWARKLPIHVVQQLAGHSDIKTTEQFYLPVQPADIAKARALQAALLEIPRNDLTDPKRTHSAPRRRFPGRRGCQKKPQPL